MKSVVFLIAAVSILASGVAGATTDLPWDAPTAVVSHLAAHAPLALSGDGRWRLHVDAKQIMHRVRIDGSVPETRIDLPLPISTVALADDGRRAAVVAPSGCVGVVDFAAGLGAAHVKWLTDARLPGPTVAWSPAPAPSCQLAPDPGPGYDHADESYRIRAVALSTSGRLLATGAGVIDLETARVVARMPEATVRRNMPLLLRLQFLERDRQLMALFVRMEWKQDGDYVDAPPFAAVWDLPSGTMRRMDTLPSADETPGPAPAVVPPPVFDPDERPVLAMPSCGPTQPLPWFDDEASGREVPDPLGRWRAFLAWDTDERIATRPRREGGGTVQVMDAEGRSLLSEFHFRGHVGGLAVAQDGSTVYGLLDPTDGRVDEPARLLGDGVVAWPMPVAGRAAHSSKRAQWLAQVCDAAGEAPDARHVVVSDRPLREAWRRPITSAYAAKMAAFRDPTQWGCTDEDLGVTTFVRADGTLWLDEFTAAAQLDPATGRTLRRFTVARGRDICVRPVPEVDGFFTWQGDTLTLRRFDSEAGSRKLLESRKGWHVTLVTVHGDHLVVLWEAKAETLKHFPPAEVTGHGLPVHAVTYDLATGRLLSDKFEEDPIGEQDTADIVRDPLRFERSDTFEANCRQPPGPRRREWDLRIAELDSILGAQCATGRLPLRTVFWTGLDLTPGPPVDWKGDYTGASVRGLDGSIGVVEAGLRLRVFDIAHRRELGRIVLAMPDSARGVRVLAALRLVLVETMVYEPGDKTGHLMLVAYALPTQAP